MSKIMKNNIAYAGSYVNSIKELTMAEYTELEAAGQINSDTAYFISDASFEPETLTAQSISYDDTNTQMGINNVQQAIESLQQLGASGGGSSTDDDFMESVYSYTNTATVNTYPENKLFTVLDKYKFLSIIFYETESGQIHDHIYIPVPVVARMKEKTEMIRFTLKYPTETTYIEIGSTNPEYGYTFVYHHNAPVGTTLEILGIGKTALYDE